MLTNSIGFREGAKFVLRFPSLAAVSQEQGEGGVLEPRTDREVKTRGQLALGVTRQKTPGVRGMWSVRGYQDNITLIHEQRK